MHSETCSSMHSSLSPSLHLVSFAHQCCLVTSQTSQTSKDMRIFAWSLHLENPNAINSQVSLFGKWECAAPIVLFLAYGDTAKFSGQQDKLHLILCCAQFAMCIYVSRGFSSLALLTFWTRYFSGVRGCLVPCSMFNSIPGLHSPVVPTS